MISTQSLHDSIQANPAAKALADSGNDAGCAALIAATLPPVSTSRFIDGSTILGAFGDPSVGYSVWTDLAAVGSQNPVLGLALKWVQPGTPGIDVGNPHTVGMLLSLVGATPNLTLANMNTLIALGQQPAVVTAGQVSDAWLQYRTGGIVPK